MGLFYKPAPKEQLESRNKLFVEKGIPALYKNGFIKSPFSGAWYGRNNHSDYSYELCRLKNNSELEILSVYIIRNESWIQIRLNIFQLKPSLNSIEELNGLDGIHFHLPPNKLTEMRLRSDDYKGIPLFYMLFCKQHKIGSYYTEGGFKRKVNELADLIEKDMTNIDSFSTRWKEIHHVSETDWEGKRA